MNSNSKRAQGVLLSLAAVIISSVYAPAAFAKDDTPQMVLEKLERGEIIVGIRNIGSQKFVTGKVLINHTPDKVWPVMVNPFEFQGKISPRMKHVEVLKDKQDVSILKVTMNTFPIPDIVYLVESKYERTEGNARIEFWRVGGQLKDFRGFWEMSPADHGKKTCLTYSMYIDPGFFVPQWIMREAVKGELPRTLIGLRNRVSDVVERSCKLEEHTILAASPVAVQHIVR